jgi:hypothetical protein
MSTFDHLARQPVVLDHHILAFHEAGFVEALTEFSAKARGFLGRPTGDKADNRHRGLLRAAASGHAAAAPPSSVMNSRRFIIQLPAGEHSRRDIEAECTAHPRRA